MIYRYMYRFNFFFLESFPDMSNIMIVIYSGVHTMHNGIDNLAVQTRIICLYYPQIVFRMFYGLVYVEVTERLPAGSDRGQRSKFITVKGVVGLSTCCTI